MLQRIPVATKIYMWTLLQLWFMTNNPWRLWRIINPCSHPHIILTNSGGDIVPMLQCAQLLHDASCSVFTCEYVTTCPHLPARPNMSEIVINESGILSLLKNAIFLTPRKAKQSASKQFNVSSTTIRVLMTTSWKSWGCITEEISNPHRDNLPRTAEATTTTWTSRSPSLRCNKQSMHSHETPPQAETK